MSGYWQNSNISALLNQALQASSTSQFNQQPAINSSQAALGQVGQNSDSARALFSSTIPQPSGAARALFSSTIPQPSCAFSHQRPNITKSRITLPPSLANKRKKNDQTDGSSSSTSTQVYSAGNEASIAGQGNFASNSSQINSLNKFGADVRYCLDNVSNRTPSVNFLSSNNTQPKLPTFDVLASKTNESDCKEPEAPAFSTELAMGKTVASKPEPVKESILLTAQNTHNKSFSHSVNRIMHDNDHWHKFIISGPVLNNREKILKRILEATEPTLLLPVMYQEEKDTAVFYARNCGSAIERMCRNSQLVFELDSQKFVLQILLQCAPVHRLKLNAMNIIKKILEKRYNTRDRCLDLSNFEHDSDLAETMFCPLWQPSVLHYVLSSAIMFPINFRTLRLCYNGIRQLKVDVLRKACYLRALDLSHNELLYQNDIKDLKDLNQVKKLVLDGNPLCADFRTSEEYISKIKSLMPQLKSLDNISLFGGSILVPKERNFLCSKNGHQMVDQFLKHFFDRYDWKDRLCLDGLYHNSAIFTLTCTHLSGQTTSEGCSLTWYMTHNHNIAKLSDYSKAEKNVYFGPDEILELFSSLPATEHDPYSFNVDLMHYNDKAAVISVAGVFREHPSLPPDHDHMRSFRRVFALCCTAPNEWQIINEQLHVSNLTTEQADSAFKIRRPPVEAPVAAWLVQDAQLLSDAEKDQMTWIMMQLTTLNKEWTTKFLMNNHWYVREALIAFVKKFEDKELPQEAFVDKN